MICCVVRFHVDYHCNVWSARSIIRHSQSIIHGQRFCVKQPAVWFRTRGRGPRENHDESGHVLEIQITILSYFCVFFIPTLYIDGISQANIDIYAIHIDEATIDIDAIHIYEATIGVDAIYIGGIRGPDLPERARDLGVVGLVDS